MQNYYISFSTFLVFSTIFRFELKMEFDDEYAPVPTYEEEDTSEEEEESAETEELTVKSRKKRQWVYKETFDSNEEAEEWLTQNKLWGYLKD